MVKENVKKDNLIKKHELSLILNFFEAKFGIFTAVKWYKKLKIHMVMAMIANYKISKK